MKKVMVFGVFDGIHEGHLATLKEAKALGDYLIAVVAQDHVVEHLHGNLPNQNLVERFEHLQNVDGVDKVVIGDAHLSTWQVIERYKPDVIAIGRDQDELKRNLLHHLAGLRGAPEIKTLASFEPNPHEKQQ